MNLKETEQAIASGALDAALARLYGGENTAFQRERYGKALAGFRQQYGDDGEIRLLSVPGRSEVGGNHTDHNAGRVLACSVDLDIIAVTRKTDTGVVRVKSEGFPEDAVDLSELAPVKKEQFRSQALVRGIAARLKELGYAVGGLDAYTTSRVLKGSGLSSSAAFEIMGAHLHSVHYNNGGIDPVTMAKVGQYAEREYFGKPCGLMDQMGCAVGGLIAIDFKDAENPVLEKMAFDFAATGYTLCIVDTAGDHASLNDDYAAVQSEMKRVAKELGHAVLRECDERTFYERIPELRKKLGDRAVLRAIHFFNDNERVAKEVAALRGGDFEAFLRLVIESGRSSFDYLQNVYSIKTPEAQGLPLALALSERLLAGRGAWRVHGGGFAGTIQAFVPNDLVGAYRAEMDRVFGEGACYCMKVRPEGAAVVL